MLPFLFGYYLRRFPGRICHWRGADGMRSKGAAEVREERRVAAGHTSDEQRGSAPVCAALFRPSRSSAVPLGSDSSCRSLKNP